MPIETHETLCIDVYQIRDGVPHIVYEWALDVGKVIKENHERQPNHEGFSVWVRGQAGQLYDLGLSFMTPHSLPEEQSRGPGIILMRSGSDMPPLDEK
ncbi:MAG: hypothetical protein R3E57_00560 [Porticoccaceae bacterium]